jgi:hypothetical protein
MCGMAFNRGQVNRPFPDQLTSRLGAGGIFRQEALLQLLRFHGLAINARARMFAGYATFSSGVCHDPHAYRGIWKRCCPAFQALEPGRELWHPPADAPGEAFLGKQQFQAHSRV